MPKAMTANRYRQLLRKLELSQVGAARFLDVDERTSRRWAAGELVIPQSVCILLELMAFEQWGPDDVLRRAGMRLIDGLNRGRGRVPKEEPAP